VKRAALVIGLTGNIGCGKSTVGAILQSFGAAYLDADAIVHRLLAPGTPTAARVVAQFDGRITRPDGSIDRRALGAIVFNDPAALQTLEQIVHPAVLDEVHARIAHSEHEVLVVDAVKLIESGLADEVDSLWVVTCPRQLQLERLMRDRGLSAEEANARIDAQPPQEERARRADVVIHNAGTREELVARVTEAYQQTRAAWRARCQENRS